MDHLGGLRKIRTSSAQIRRWKEFNAMENEKQNKESFEQRPAFEKILIDIALDTLMKRKREDEIRDERGTLQQMLIINSEVYYENLYFKKN